MRSAACHDMQSMAQCCRRQQAFNCVKHLSSLMGPRNNLTPDFSSFVIYDQDAIAKGVLETG